MNAKRTSGQALVFVSVIASVVCLTLVGGPIAYSNRICSVTAPINDARGVFDI